MRTPLGLLAATAMLAVLAGCGAGAPTRSVAAVATERDADARRVVVSLPQNFVLGPGAARPAGEPVAAPADEPVETLVEPPSPLPDDVVVIGDSLTVSAVIEIESSLRTIGLDVVAIDALESRRIANGGSELPPGVAAITDVLDAGADPGLWVIALGTNDVGSGGNVEGLRASMRELLALIPGDAAVVWVDVWIGGREGAAAEANEAIRAELRTREGGAAVVDWFARGAADDGSIAGDGVHLTASGRSVFAASIVDAIDSLYR